MPKDFAEALGQQLEKKSISAYRLSQLSGVARQSISDFLAGKTTPGIEIAAKLAKALGISMDDLLWDNIPIPSPPEPGTPGRPKKDSEGEDKTDEKKPRGRRKKSE